MEHSMYLRTSVSFAKHGNPCARGDIGREDPGEYFPGAACRVVFPMYFQRRGRGKKDVEKLWFRRQIRWDWRFVSSIDTELTQKQILDKTQFYPTPVRRYINHRPIRRHSNAHYGHWPAISMNIQSQSGTHDVLKKNKCCRQTNFPGDTVFMSSLHFLVMKPEP